MSRELKKLVGARDRTVVGVMSGTSLDGIDVVLARLSGSGESLSWKVLGSRFEPYEEELVHELRDNSAPSTSAVDRIALLNVRLAYAYDAAIRAMLIELECPLESVDVIGTHGQTIFHQGEPVNVAGMSVAATLQIGDPSTLANILNRPVVGDFRMADMALGGQGAPLVPYFDYICFRHPTENRMALNLGGIANVSVIPADSDTKAVVAFDTGPANMVIDALCKRLFDTTFDRSGEIAASGKIDQNWVSELLQLPYFSQSPPKSTGRELFSPAFVDSFLETGSQKGLSNADIVATATSLTVQSIADAYNRFVKPETRVDRIIVSGGGVHNNTIMDGLRSSISGVEFNSISAFEIDPDEKEALCFAILAHETLNGVATNIPSATGAERTTVLGKICIP